MARLEDLIAEITDPRLREALAAEAAALKKEKKFGLVFEDHVPEQVLLPRFPLRPGLCVARRTQPREVFTVADMLPDGTCRLVPENGGEETAAPAEELVAVKRFGEPIYPALTPVARLGRGGDKPWHTIINADNFHALQLILYCYEGQVDVIYIDPPYNTGARDWKYNNDYVDANDRWRHSKWLSMMKKRLELAKRLLKPDIGTLIVTIDEHEVHHLGVLLEEVFPHLYRQMVTIVINQKGVAQGRLSRAEEYAIFCFAPGAEVVAQEDDLLSPDRADGKGVAHPRWERLLRGGTNSRREDRCKLFFPIYVDPERKSIVRIGEPLLPVTANPDLDADAPCTVAWPIRTDGSFGNWRVSPATLRTLLAKGYVKLGGFDESRRTWTVLYVGERTRQQIEEGEIEIVHRDPTAGAVELAYTRGHRRQIKTVWHRPTHDSGVYGSSLLRTVLGEGAAFAFPKSLYAVRDSLRILLANKPNALVVDFFAGSGTTYHATCLLNAEDWGNRRCILVTNNEVEEREAKRLVAAGHFPGDPEYDRHGICEAVTWPRCKFVTQGHRDDGTPLPGEYQDGREMREGFAENVEYFRLNFLDPSAVAYGREFAAVLPILWLMAGARGERAETDGDADWFLPDNSPFAVLLRERAFAAFRRALEDRPDVEWVFLVTDSGVAYREMLSALPVGTRTKQLYKSYLDNFKINTEANL